LGRESGLKDQLIAAAFWRKSWPAPVHRLSRRKRGFAVGADFDAAIAMMIEIPW
jgi:hypothetical protein